jgi:signal transduction histidine kinase
MSNQMAASLGGAPASPEVVPGLWELLNRPRPFEPRTARIGCALLAATYLAMAVLRHDPDHPDFAWVRGAIAAYALLGVAIAGRLRFATLRAYTVGLAFLLSLGGGLVAAELGNDPMQLPLTGLCTFVAVAFLQTARDVGWVVPGLAIGHALLLIWLPPVHVALASVIVMIASALLTGAATSLIVLAYSARLNQSLDWWRDACKRERDALRAKSAFLSTMSHELRSPLHVIIGYAEMVADDVPPEVRPQIQRIRSSAVDLLQLVENTMNAARLEAGKLTVRLEDFDVAALMRELAENVAALPEAKAGVAVRWRVPEGMPPVRLDRLKVKEIVQNLASNALKFTREGEVSVGAAREGESLRIEVRDTGPGISAAAQARIFEMFERVEAEDDHLLPGAGLGLFIVRSLVGLLGGTIAVESAPGRGTCFTVRLPLRASAVRAAA